MLGLGSSITTSSGVYGSVSTSRTWTNDSSLITSQGFGLFSWSGDGATLSFEDETGTLDGESNYAKLVVDSTQIDSCAWRDSSVKDDSGDTIVFNDYTNYRVEAKMYASLDSSRTQITFSTSFGSSTKNRFETTLQDETWTSIDVSGTYNDTSSTHFYLWDFDKSGNFPIAGEFFALKDVKLSLS